MGSRASVRDVFAVLSITVLVTAMVACAPTPDQYDLTMASTQGGSVTAPGEGTFTYGAGTEVGLTATPSEGYRFVSWFGDLGAVASVYSASTTVVMGDHYSITAEFESVSGISEPPPPPVWNPQRQALLPDREFDTNWTQVTNWYPALHRSIDAIWLSWELVPSVIHSPADANVSTMLGLSEGHPPGDGPIVLRYVFAKNLPDGVSLDLVVRLYDGDDLVGEWIEENIPATWTVQERTLVSEQHDWFDLRVELTRLGDTTAPESELRQVCVSLVELEMPYPEEFIFPYLNPATATHAPGSDTVQRPPGVQEGDVVFVSSFNGEAAEGFDLIYSQASVEDAPQQYYLRTWWKRAGPNEPASYTFPNAEGLWAARVSGAGERAPVAAGHREPPPDGFTSPVGIWTPSVEAPVDNCLIIRISANSGYITWTEPHQWVAWDQWPCPAASWRFQRERGPTGEEYHGTGSFIHWVAQTIAIAPD